MKKIVIFLIIIAFTVGSLTNIHARNTLKRQLRKNFSIGYDLNFGNDFYSRNFHIGTGYSEKFSDNPKAYWQVGGDINWNRYVLYDKYDDAFYDHNSLLRTTSLSFPFVLGYNVKRTMFTGLKVYAGPVYEMIFTSRLNGDPYYDINHGQLGFTVGTKIRFLVFFNARIAYNFYPYGLFSNGDLNRSALNLSIGL